jgi:hypothetical protein
VLAQHLAVVAGHDHVGVGRQLGEQEADLLVHEGDLAVVEPMRPLGGVGEAGRRAVLLVRVVVVDPQEVRGLEPVERGERGRGGAIGGALGDHRARGIAGARAEPEPITGPLPGGRGAFLIQVACCSMVAVLP